MFRWGAVGQRRKRVGGYDIGVIVCHYCIMMLVYYYIIRMLYSYVIREGKEEQKHISGSSEPAKGVHF